LEHDGSDMDLEFDRTCAPFDRDQKSSRVRAVHGC
jgi:hypothetical protein